MRLNLGCGPNRIDGYVGCDLIDGPAVDVVCSVDSLPFDDNTAEEILCEHVIEHLTFEQFNRAIIEWHRVLKVGGVLIIECPDLLGLCKQFVESNEFGRYQSYKGYWPIIAHFYGHQRGSNDDEKFAQIHKTGYTLEHLVAVLDGTGFGKFEEYEPEHGVPHTCVIRLKSTKLRKEPHRQ